MPPQSPPLKEINPTEVYGMDICCYDWGQYDRTDQIVNGKPIYETLNGHQLVYDNEVWVFTHNPVGRMAELGQSNDQIYPETLRNWTFTDPSGLNFVDYYFVPIFCTSKNVLFFIFHPPQKKMTSLIFSSIQMIFKVSNFSKFENNNWWSFLHKIYKSLEKEHFSQLALDKKNQATTIFC